MASTILDLPQPLGPMMQVSPLPLKVICVFSQNDLNPTNSTLRSLSKISPFMASAAVAPGERLPRIGLHQRPYLYIDRNAFRLLGRVRAATKSLKGRFAVAQPPGATMAVTGEQINTRRVGCKDASAYRATRSYQFAGRSFLSACLGVPEVCN